MTLRSQNACGDCGDTWYPRGRQRSHVCPNCRSPNVYINNRKQGAGCFTLVVILALAYWAYTHLGEIEKLIPQPNDKPGPRPQKDIKAAPVQSPATTALPPAKIAPKPQPDTPKVIKISATSENAIALAKQRYELAREIFNDERFERTENAAVSLTTALQLVTESSKILSKLGQLDHFADKTLARHIISLRKDCQRRLKELEALGIKAPQTAKTDAVIEIVEKPVPVKLDTKPSIGNKSGFGGSDVYNAQFTLENKLPHSVNVKTIQVIFYDAFELEIGKVPALGQREINPGSRNKYTAKYLGNDADKIQSFKVIIE